MIFCPSAELYLKYGESNKDPWDLEKQFMAKEGGILDTKTAYMDYMGTKSCHAKALSEKLGKFKRMPLELFDVKRMFPCGASDVPHSGLDMGEYLEALRLAEKLDAHVKRKDNLRDSDLYT